MVNARLEGAIGRQYGHRLIPTRRRPARDMTAQGSELAGAASGQRGRASQIALRSVRDSASTE